jgi:type I restriction enzyme M protein
MAKSTKKSNEPLEQQLFLAADKMRQNMDAAEYKHYVLGLIFLKYISDSFDQRREEIKDEYSNPESEWFISNHEEREQAITEDLEDRDVYKEKNIFWVPQEARWSYIQSKAKDPAIGKVIDSAMKTIESENPKQLKNILPSGFAREQLSSDSLGGLIDLISDIDLKVTEKHSKDVLGRIYEYFLGEFASAEGKKGGQFYTPKSIVKMMVEMIEPYKGRVYDPCCGSGGMFVMSEKFVQSHQGRIEDISIYGQESNLTTYKLCRMNLAIRGIDGSQVKWNAEGSFLKNEHPDLQADYILANPPFNISDWSGDKLIDDARWTYGTPPAGNANFGWIQHMLFHLAPKGTMATVLANGSLTSNSSGEGEIRKNLIEADLVDCIVALPPKLFYNTQIPACLWFLSRNRDRKGEILFIDATELGHLVSRKNKDFSEADIAQVAEVYHAWKRKEGYEDVKGFCKSASLVEVRQNNHVLTPGQYVGIPDEEDDGVPFEEKIQTLSAQLEEYFTEEARLTEEIRKVLVKVREM